MKQVYPLHFSSAFLYCLAAFGLLATGCAVAPRKNIIALMDNSLSQGQATFDRYLDLCQKSLIPTLKTGDNLTVLMLDECVTQRDERIYSLDLSESNFAFGNVGENNLEDSIKVRTQRYLKDSVVNQIRRTIINSRNSRRGCGQYTDIVNAMRMAAPLIRTESNADSTWEKISNVADGEDLYAYQTIILIFSDMVHESQELNLLHIARWPEDSIAAAIDQLKTAGKIPDLSGTILLVYGATNTDRIRRKEENLQIDRIHTFWELYAKAANARLAAYGFDTKREISQILKQP